LSLPTLSIFPIFLFFLLLRNDFRLRDGDVLGDLRLSPTRKLSGETQGQDPEEGGNQIMRGERVDSEEQKDIRGRRQKRRIQETVQEPR